MQARGRIRSSGSPEGPRKHPAGGRSGSGNSSSPWTVWGRAAAYGRSGSPLPERSFPREDHRSAVQAYHHRRRAGGRDAPVCIPPPDKKDCPISYAGDRYSVPTEYTGKDAAVAALDSISAASYAVGETLNIVENIPGNFDFFYGPCLRPPAASVCGIAAYRAGNTAPFGPAAPGGCPAPGSRRGRAR